MMELVALTVVVLILVIGLVVGFRKWVEHERARTDEIRRRERLRVLLRREEDRRPK